MFVKPEVEKWIGCIRCQSGQLLPGRNGPSCVELDQNISGSDFFMFGIRISVPNTDHENYIVSNVT